jgi:hypothetical protein
MLLLLRQGGAGWVLILAVLENCQLAILGGLQDQGRFVYSPNAMHLATMVPIVMVMWTMVGQFHARLVLSAIELRVPRALRMLCFTLSGLAAWTLLELIAPIVILHGPYFMWLEFMFYAICAGFLAALFTGTHFGTPITFSCIAVAFIASMGSHTVSPQWVEIPAVALPFLIAWRLRVLIRVLRAGSHGDLVRSLAAVGSNMTDRWSADSGAPASSGAHQVLTTWRRAVFGDNTGLRQRNVDRSSVEVLRVSLGPLYERRVSWILLCFAPIPIMILLGSHARFFKSPALVLVPFLGLFAAFFLLNRVRRLADLLCNPSGEISDLALLPGLGGRSLQRRALLREALVRPLAYYGLFLSGMVGSCWVLLGLSQATIDPILFLAAPPFAVLMLFAMMTVGVLSGRLGRYSTWFDRSAFFVIPPMFLSFAGLGFLSSHDWTPSLSTWQRIAWVAVAGVMWVTVLGVMAACLIRWGIQLSRRPNLLCR